MKSATVNPTRNAAPGSCPVGLSHLGRERLSPSTVGLLSLPMAWLLHFFTKQTLGTAPLPSENHARKMRTFFTRRLEPRSPHGECAERLSQS